MRILHVTDTYGPTVGGIEVLVQDLSERQVAAGHEVTVLTRTPGHDPLGAAVRVCREPDRLTQLVRTADVVHAHVSACSPLALRGMEAGAAAGVPTVAAVHSMWGAAWPVVRAVGGARGWPALPVQWAAVSEAAAGPVRRALPGRSVIVLPNAVDVAAWTQPPRSTQSDVVTVVSVMRMARRKRPLHLVQALRRLAAVRPAGQVRAVLVGEGPQRREVARTVNRLGLGDWVSVPGTMTHPEIRELYRTADIFVAPATRESFGIAALEARAAGLTVVTRSGTGVSDFVTDGLDGLVARSDAALADGLVRLSTDRALLDRLRLHSAAHPPAFDWADVLWRNAYGYELAAGLLDGRSAGGRLQAPLSALRPESPA